MSALDEVVRPRRRVGARWIVCERSAAETPVVMPSLASIGFVYAVPCRDSRLDASTCSASSSQRSSRKAQADEASTVRSHEVHGLRRGELGGDRQVALVLTVGASTTTTNFPWRMSSIASSIVANGAVRVSAEAGIPRRVAESDILIASNRSTYFPMTSASMFTSSPGVEVAERRRDGCVVDERDSEGVVRTSSASRSATRPTTVIDPFSTHGAQHIGRASIHMRGPSPSGSTDPHAADPVDVPLHDVATELVAGASAGSTLSARAELQPHPASSARSVSGSTSKASVISSPRRP